MSEEKEIKVQVLDDLSVDSIKIILEDLFSVEFKEGKNDKDVYYDYEDNHYFNLNHALRIRNSKEVAYKCLFYVPAKETTPWFVLEKEFDLPISKENLKGLFAVANINCTEIPDILNADKLKFVFEKIKLQEKMYIDKTRWTGTNDIFHICIDSIEKLGLFIEVEVKDDKLLQKFMEKLPFNFKEIRHGYQSLYAEHVLKIEVPNYKDKFLENPDWNILDGQKELIQKLIQK